MSYLMIKRYKNTKETQKEVNKFFMETVKALYNDIIDEAFKMCYERYGLYPNAYALKIMLQQLKNNIEVDVSVSDDDLYNVNRGF